MSFPKNEVSNLINSFVHLKVMVVGDVMVDSYLRGKVDRISPEAPVPVVALQKRDNMLGGAANVALNVKSLGADVLLCSVIGDDRQGELLIELMQKEQLSTNGIIRSSERITTTKYRIIGNRMQMLRVDEEIDTDLNPADTKLLLNNIAEQISTRKPDVIVLQDYNKGILTSEVISRVISMAKVAGIPVAVDPKKKNFSAFKNVSLFKPNLKEISEGLKTEIIPTSLQSLDEAAKILHQQFACQLVMITLSEHGIYISSYQSGIYSSQIIPAVVRSISDVSGAGDTVISVAALCLASGVQPGLMAALANLAGGLVCEQSGVVPVDKLRLLSEAQAEL